MGMCALYCITVSKNCNVRDAAEKAAVVKGLFLCGVFFFSLRKEMIKPTGLRFHQIQWFLGWLFLFSQYKIGEWDLSQGLIGGLILIRCLIVVSQWFLTVEGGKAIPFECASLKAVSNAISSNASSFNFFLSLYWLIHLLSRAIIENQMSKKWLSIGSKYLTFAQQTVGEKPLLLGQQNEAERSFHLDTDKWLSGTSASSWRNLLTHKDIFNLVESDFQNYIRQLGI